MRVQIVAGLLCIFLINVINGKQDSEKSQHENTHATTKNQQVNPAVDRILRRIESFRQNEKQKIRKERYRRRNEEKQQGRRHSADIQKQRFLEHMNSASPSDDDGGNIDGTLSFNRRIITVECKTTPLFFCPECRTKLQEEQDDAIDYVRSLYDLIGGSGSSVRVVQRIQKISNIVYLEVPSSDGEEQDITNSIESTLKLQLSGVKRVLPHRTHYVSLDESVPYVGGGNEAEQKYCRTGKGVTVGVLDTGIDYTHLAFGGLGTVGEYSRAYGRFATDSENTVRDIYFPTDVVIEGYDFLGETDNSTLYKEDDDPIDGHGHGTRVASAILAVAPDVKFLAVKTCATTRFGQCPEFAIMAGIEYVLDPNRDGNPDDKVDIINLSVGSDYTSTYYEPIAEALENAFALGSMPITSFGNGENIPYVAGSVGTTNNILAVGGTSHPSDDPNDDVIFMEEYSSRGPGENNMLKPDLSAPSGSRMAVAGSGTRYESLRGTSFSSPLVSGGAALLMDRCKSCSLFAIKALLMNTSYRNVRYGRESDFRDKQAPVSLMGSGEIRLDAALDADFWAYSLEDVQPSISLGLVQATEDVDISRTLVITSLTDAAYTLKISSEFRDPEDEASGAITILFNDITGGSEAQDTVKLSKCGEQVQFRVSFHVAASKCPPNRMVSAGVQGRDPRLLDLNEFDGHIVISALENPEKEIVLPFHALLRQASNAQLLPGSLLPSYQGPVNGNFSITNNGAGVAQIDAYDIIYMDVDRPEGDFGGENQVSDLRSIGYRTVPVNEDGCDYLVEFAFTMFESSKHIGLSSFVAIIGPDLESVENADTILVVPEGIFPTECYVAKGEDIACTGFPPDHSTNSRNTIIRACSNDLGLIEGETNVFYVQFIVFESSGVDFAQFTNETEIRIPFPQPRLSAPSYDILPGETLNEFTVTGNLNRFVTGLQLVTNAFRSFDSTGAATVDSETLYLVRDDPSIMVPEELTPDILELPVATDLTGPDCNWKSMDCMNVARSSLSHETAKAQQDEAVKGDVRPLQEEDSDFTGCPPSKVPRLQVPTHRPSETPSANPTGPTFKPTDSPTGMPAKLGDESPTKTPSSTLVSLRSGSVTTRTLSYYSSPSRQTMYSVMCAVGIMVVLTII